MNTEIDLSNYRQVYISTINETKDNSFEFERDGCKYRVECRIDTNYDGWFDNRIFHLYFQTLINYNGYWYRENDTPISAMDEYTRREFPKEVEIVKEQLSKHIMKL